MREQNGLISVKVNNYKDIPKNVIYKCTFVISIHKHIKNKGDNKFILNLIFDFKLYPT